MGELAVVASPDVRSGYREVARIEDPDGIMAIISARVNGPPLVTIGLYKTFERDGEQVKTAFWTLKQAPAVLRVVGIAVERARQEEDKLRAEHEARQGRR